MPLFKKLIAGTFIFLIAPFCCLAQYTISGKILNHSDKSPVANASVFLTNATIGNKSTDAGTFLLRDVKPGKYTLIVSVVGFEAYSESLIVTNSNVILPDIEIAPKTKTLKEVTIRVDPNRDRNLEWFTDEFLGTSDMAKDCKIINPEILDLDYDDATSLLTASSSDEFLIIENNALGYRINYLLTNFTLNNRDRTAKEVHYDGSVLFKEMEGTPAQKQKWEDNRQEVYQNSMMHFLRSLINDKVTKEGFKVQQVSIYANPDRPDESLIQAKIEHYKNPKLDTANRRDSLSYWNKKAKLQVMFQKLMKFSLDREEIFKLANQQGLYMLGCDNDALYVTYNKGKHFHVYNHYDRLDGTNSETTVINFTRPFALVDGKGELMNPNDAVFSGVWALKRVADLLPINYEAPQDIVTAADSIVSKKVNNKLNIFLANHSTEKAYLHFDRPYYAAGDTIYFKAYVTNEGKHELSGTSGVLNVDLLNEKNKTEQSIRLQLNNGLAWGEFVLTDTLPKGNYQVRAYTRWMKNSVDAGFFNQVIPIAAVRNIRVPESAEKQPQQLSTAKADIQFFPEGGDLVTGIRSKVAFKAMGSNGLGINTKGVIVDNDNKEVCSFASTHLGMGYFYMEPHENKTYKARIAYADGTQNVVDLPKAHEKGIVLSINDDPSSKTTVKIQANKASYQENSQEDYTLVIYSGGITTNFICKLNKPTVSLNIEKNEFPSGITRITFFSPKGEPLSERLIFIKNTDLLNLKISSDKVDYAKREKIRIDLKALNGNERPAKGHFSVAVIDESRVPVNENNENTILTNLLLTSDLKGYVEQPNYYFASNTDEVYSNLDLLMLTHGYRRFEWEQVLHDNEAPVIAYQPERSLEIAGMVKTASGKSVPNGEITLIAADNNLVIDTVTARDGNFKFTGLNIAGNPIILLRARKENKNDDVKIELKQPDDFKPIWNPLSGDTHIPPQAVALMQQRFIEAGGAARTFKEVTIKGYKAPPKPIIEHSANLNGPGHANYVIMGDQLVNCTDLSCLYGKIPGTIAKNGALFLNRTGERLGEKGGFGPPPMVIILDGMLFQQAQNPLSMLNINDINSIEVLTSGSYLAIYGSSAAGGALIITTKQGSENAHKPIVTASGLVRFPFKGFYKSRAFYSPKYDHPDDGFKQKDLRPTIYWKPELTTDKDGNASFEYYNADSSGTYRLVIEGIDGAGNIGRQVYRYRVE